MSEVTLFLPVCQVYNSARKILTRKELKVKILIRKDLALTLGAIFSLVENQAADRETILSTIPYQLSTDFFKDLQTPQCSGAIGHTAPNLTVCPACNSCRKENPAAALTKVTTASQIGIGPPVHVCLVQVRPSVGLTWDRHVLPSRSRSSFVHNIEGRFRSPPELAESSRDYYLSHARLSGLGA
jgi:hypothetical protein